MAPKPIDRRQALALLSSIPIASALSWTSREVAAAQGAARRAGARSASEFFTAHERETVKTLVDLIIPSDERSPSASEAGVVEFLDFMMLDSPERQVAMRGGLAWIDRRCQERFDRTFVDAADDERRAVVDEVAFPDRAPPHLAHGVEFFNRFRDLTATGFFTSKMGFEDLDYRGNEFVTEWTGCPEEALRKLGLGAPER